ncbi:MAG: hypothetical protein HPAVJP_3400 [Candidatus Hepatoplasma vulgare]|nr:MAG: hypothetical protein HPAVJP_3400 [Candidatus Hepatoplasma sp.]
MKFMKKLQNYNTKIILISGGSCSGKTSLSLLIKKELGKNKVNLISMDDYYFPKSHFKDKLNINWDVPEAYDLTKFKKDINMLLNGKEVKKNIFIYGKDVYKKEKENLYPKEFLIIEGIFSPYFEDIQKKAYKNIFLYSSKKIRYNRRREKDSKSISNFSEENLKKYWKKEIKEFEKKYLKKFKKGGKLIKTNNLENNQEKILQKIIKYINK